MSQRNIIIAVVVLLILAGIGYFFFSGSSQDVGLQSTGGQSNATSSTETSVNSDVVLSQLNQLQQITLNTDFLSSTEFQGLENFSISINEQPTGRDNPFIPALNQTPPTITSQPLSASFSTPSDQNTTPNQSSNQPPTPTNFPNQGQNDSTTSGANQQ